MAGNDGSAAGGQAMADRRQQIQDDDYAFPYHYVPRFSPGYSHTYSWPWGLYYVSAMELVLEKVRALRPGSVADIGTGDGRMVRELALMLPEARVTGVDYSERAIQLARALNPQLDFRCVDIVGEGLAETFDVVTLVEVFEHIPPELTAGFVAALRRLIRDDGTLIVTVPHSNVKVTKKHFQHFSRATLLAHFGSQFDLEECLFLDRRSRAVGWLRALLENRYFILVHWGLRNRLYQLYKRSYLVTDEPRCGRILMRLRPKSAKAGTP
jgi:SAM-dependent methyltransferase